MPEKLQKHNLVTCGSTSEKDLEQPGLGKGTFPQTYSGFLLADSLENYLKSSLFFFKQKEKNKDKPKQQNGEPDFSFHCL